MIENGHELNFEGITYWKSALQIAILALHTDRNALIIVSVTLRSTLRKYTTIFWTA